MIEVQILIPIADNAGNLFGSVSYDEFQDDLLRLFGGCSGPSNPVPGAWRSPEGKVYFDSNRNYTIALESITLGNLIKVAVDFAKLRFGQEKIYIRYLGLSEIL